jgi:exonuclease SbcC
MIKYNYLLEREEGEGRIRKFTPDRIPSDIPNLLCIEGPNSIGKSTLMNIIALSFWGAESKRIHPTLLEKMSTLINSDYQRLKFHLEISSEKEKLVLRSAKVSPNKVEITHEESIDGKPFKPITRERFEDKYNLIYDIVSNPIERLYDSLKDLREEERHFGNRIRDFGAYLRQTLKDIDSSRNKERLDELRIKINDITQENADITNELPNLVNSLNLFETHAYVRFYYYYVNECETLGRKKTEYEQKSQKLEKDGKKIGGKLIKYRRDIENLRRGISESYQQATPLVQKALSGKQKGFLKIWKELNPYSTDKEDLNTLRHEAIQLRSLFQTQSDKLREDNSFKDASTLQRLIEALQEFEYSSLVIPRLKVTIGELVRILKDENKRNFLLMSQYKNLSNIETHLGDIIGNVDSLLRELSELGDVSVTHKQLSDEALKSFFEQKNQLQIIRENLVELGKKRDYYLRKCESKNIDINRLKSTSYINLSREIPADKKLERLLALSEEQIMQKIAELENDISQAKRKLGENKTFLSIFQKERDKLEKQKPHQFEDYRDEIGQLLQKAETVSQKLLINYDSDIMALIEKNVDRNEVEEDPSKKNHYEEISRYLAHRIGVFPHIDRKYKATTVDLVSGIIRTDDGSVIRVKDIGTGQSQSAYIMSLLNVPDDGRKIIALFDEIAMMDNRSLEPVREKMRQLYDSKRLLVGILVQKTEHFALKALT